MNKSIEKSVNVFKTFVGKDAGQTTGCVIILIILMYLDIDESTLLVVSPVITLIWNAVFNTTKEGKSTLEQKLESAKRTIFLLEHGIKMTREDKEILDTFIKGESKIKPIE